MDRAARTKSPTGGAPEVDVEVTTTCGPVREENQDAALVWRGDSGEVAAVVSDGMGGHADGRRAAEIVVRTSIEVVRESDGEPWGEVLGRALEEAHARVLREAGGDGMGATAVAAVLDPRDSPPRLYLAHVGDSRAYLCRGNSIYRLTEDHSQVSRLVRDGYLTEEEAFGHPDSNVILRAIGQGAPLEPELHEPVSIDPGDWIVLSSDGLHGVVPDREILAAVKRSHSAADACRTLLQLALDSHSQDNVTILCIHPPEGSRSRRPTRPG